MIWTQLHSQLHTLLKQRQLLPQQASILIALSGGQDSVCLTQLLIDLQPYWHWKLAIAHCDHQWSSDQGISDHVQSLAQKWNLPFYLQIAENLPEAEAAARHWRYQALTELAHQHGFPYLVTGHTQSDRAETFLYNLFRGSGSDGLPALRWQRALSPNCQLVRPLLAIIRSETGEFCQQLNLPIWEDACNQNPRYVRNRIRTQLLPLLKQAFNPQIEKVLAQTAEILRAEVDYLEQQAQSYYPQVCDPNISRLNRRVLKTIPLALQRRIIRHFLEQWSHSAPNFTQIEAVVGLIDAHQRSRSTSLSNKYVAEVHQEWIILTKPQN
jgi:tRNA(Ile)-lysidine synthase